MAIANVDQLIASYTQPSRFFYKTGSASVPLAGAYGSSWQTTGFPGPGSISGGAAGTALTGPGIAGQLPFVDATSGQSNYVARMMVHNSAVSHRFLLCDRLWHNSGLTANLTSSQTVNSAAWPARDQNDSTDGVGVMIGLETITTMGANAPTINVTYTNSSNAGSRAAINSYATVAAAQQGAFWPLQLAPGDVGVRSIQSLQFSGTAWASGTFSLVAYRVICWGDGATAPATVDPMIGGLPRVANGAVPFFLLQSLSSSAGVGGPVGVLTFAQG